MQREGRDVVVVYCGGSHVRLIVSSATSRRSMSFSSECRYESAGRFGLPMVTSLWWRRRTVRRAGREIQGGRDGGNSPIIDNRIVKSHDAEDRIHTVRESFMPHSDHEAHIVANAVLEWC